MALVVSRVGGSAAGPFQTSFGGMWWARAKLSWTGGSQNLAVGNPIVNEFKNVFGFSRIAFILPDAISADVGFATATGVTSGAIFTYFRALNRYFFFGIGRAVDGGAGVPIGAETPASNLTSIDALTYLVQVYGFL